jgi:hypothetical protein
MDMSTLAIEKKEYQNNTSGWIGVAVLDHDGKPQGVNVEPGGTIWLSEQEAILTARAPKRAEHNPFEERSYLALNSDGQREEIKMRPLTEVGGGARHITPSERYVPGLTQPAEARAEVERAAHDGTSGPRTGAQVAAEAAILASSVPVIPDVTPGPLPSITDEDAGEETAEGWVTTPQAPGEVLQGSLQGDLGVTPDLTDPTQPQPGDRAQPQPAAVAQTVGAALGAEEHAQQVDQKIGEETGAAVPPTGEPAEGEYAVHEEVGTPVNESTEVTE